MMAIQHDCSNHRTPGSGYHHTFGHGKGPVKCYYCKGPMVQTTGIYAVTTWRGDGNYREADALHTFQTEAKAEAKRAALDPSGDALVVRFIQTRRVSA